MKFNKIKIINKGYTFVNKNEFDKNVICFQKRMFNFSTINIFINKFNKTISYYVCLDDNISLKNIDSIKKDMLFIEIDKDINDIKKEYNLEIICTDLIYVN